MDSLPKLQLQIWWRLLESTEGGTEEWEILTGGIFTVVVLECLDEAPTRFLNNKVTYLYACSLSSPADSILKLKTHCFITYPLFMATYSAITNEARPSVAASVFANILFNFSLLSNATRLSRIYSV